MQGVYSVAEDAADGRPASLEVEREEFLFHVACPRLPRNHCIVPYFSFTHSRYR
jgi:hypothetical protein